ncbi:hypothetical protein [Metabacillus sp. 22489]|uniref:hypothetical protein n=1 Tax=Metabacillus sp. 22489 TaxID=3453928 RepID=UPI003F851E6C
MPLSRDERFELLNKIKRKRLKMKDLAQQVSCTPSLLSQYFALSCNISENREKNLIKIVNEAKEFEYRKVYLE